MWWCVFRSVFGDTDNVFVPWRCNVLQTRVFSCCCACTVKGKYTLQAWAFSVIWCSGHALQVFLLLLCLYLWEMQFRTVFGECIGVFAVMFLQEVTRKCCREVLDKSVVEVLEKGVGRWWCWWWRLFCRRQKILDKYKLWFPCRFEFGYMLMLSKVFPWESLPHNESKIVLYLYFEGISIRPKNLGPLSEWVVGLCLKKWW